MIDERLPSALDGERLDRVVALLADVSRSQAAQLIDAGVVTVDGEVTRSGKLRMEAECRVQIADSAVLEEPLPEPDVEVPFTVVDSDEALIVIDKPAGVVVHPSPGHRAGTLVNGLLARFPELSSIGPPDRPGIVHRLDAGSSGLLVVARTNDALTVLAEQFRAHQAGRRYRAMVWRHPESSRGVIDAPLGRDPRDPLRRAVVGDGKPARTHYETVQLLAGPAELAELDCTLETGRTHQIRVHLASVGHPLVGDTVYGGSRPTLGLGRPYLHAMELTVTHPTTGERKTWTRPLPDDLKSFRQSLTELH